MTHRDPFAQAVRADRRSLAFDTAPDGYAWAVVRRSGHRLFTYEDSGHVTGLTPDQIVRGARELYNRVAPDLLAVEGFGGYISTRRLQQQRRKDALDISDLLHSAFVAGMLVASLPSPHLTVVLPANSTPTDMRQWRYWLTGQMRQGDAGVALALDRMLSSGLPRRGQRRDGTPIYAINDHRRDATGLALAAWLYTDWVAGRRDV